MGHHRVLGIMRASYALLATVITTLAFMGKLTPLAVLMVAAIFGLLRPSDPGMRYALVATLLPHEQFVGAMSFLRTTMDIARIVGALSGAAAFVALGMGPAYLVVMLLYIGGALLTLAIRPPPSATTSVVITAENSAPSTWRDLKEATFYVWRTPLIRALMLIALLINLTAFPLTNGLMPYAAREVFGTDQTGLGYLVASFAVGALLGSLVLGSVHVVQLGRIIIVTTLVWHALLLAFAFMPDLKAAIACLIVAGFFQSVGVVALMVILMRSAGEKMRGRVMGLRMMVIYTLPLGLLAAGVLIGRIGYRPTVVLYTITGLILMTAIAIHWRRELWRLDAPANGG
jgi:predicted MFS family arabinose efflux permease